VSHCVETVLVKLSMVFEARVCRSGVVQGAGVRSLWLPLRPPALLPLALRL